MRFSLAQLTRRAGKLRRSRALPVITPTRSQADQLARTYMRVVRAWSEACRDRILPVYIRALEQVSQTRDSIEVRDDGPQLGASVDGAGEGLLRLLLELVPELREWVFQVERWHRGRWVQNVFSAASVDLTTMLGPVDAKETLDTVLARNVALIRDVSEEARGRIADIVLRGLQARTPAREVAKELNEAIGKSQARSVRIASDQLNKLTSALDAERQRQAGIEEWIWRHSGKRHPREDHLARNGKHYTDETAPEDEPGELPFCGCRRQAWLNLD